jgi:CRISPR/Cas system-associated endoribonuclease Cas2
VKITAALLTGLALVGASSITQAQGQNHGSRHPGVNQRQQHQQDRIQQGVNSGELNRQETRRLAHEQRDIRQLKREYQSDGKITDGERRDLHRELNESNRHIYRAKHNDASRHGGTRDPKINERQRNQKERIQQGVRSGELTRDERKQLVVEQKTIRAEEHAYKADGVLTKDERKDLQQDLNTASHHIYEEKHDAEKR